MQIKRAVFTPIGVNQDLADSKFNPQYLYDAHNIRFTSSDDNTLFIIRNEQGNRTLVLTEDSTTMIGEVVGYCVCDRDLIIFTTGDTEDGGNIYRLQEVNDKQHRLSAIWSGAGLNLDKFHPIDAIYSYETKDIRKVYFVDGKNTAKFFNIENPPTSINGFEFSPIIGGDETISVEKLDGGGQFTAGTLQYAFSYYTINGAETSLVDITPLQYPSFKDRAGKEGEIVDSSFKITINNLNSSEYDYVRLYTIERSSVDTEPKSRRIDIPITGDTITIVDNGIIGYENSIDRLLFTGGDSLIIGTIAAKDGVLFGADITINNKSLKDISHTALPVNWVYGPDALLEQDTSKGTVYNYKPFLSKSKHYKYKQLYRFGYQVQYSNGKWSEVKYIGRDTECQLQLNSFKEVRDNYSDSSPYYMYYNPVHARITIPTSLVAQLNKTDAIKIRPVMVPVTISDKDTIAQGILTNTIFNLEDRRNGQVSAVTDYITRLGNIGGIDVVGGDSFLSTYEGVSVRDAKPISNHFKTIPTLPTNEDIDELNIPFDVSISDDTAYRYNKTTSQAFPNSLMYRMFSTELGINVQSTTLSLDNKTNVWKIARKNAVHKLNLNDNWVIDENIVNIWSPDIQYNTDIDRMPADSIRLRGLVLSRNKSNSLQYIDTKEVGGPANYTYRDKKVDRLDYSALTTLGSIMSVSDTTTPPADMGSMVLFPLWTRQKAVIGQRYNFTNITVKQKKTSRLLYMSKFVSFRQGRSGITIPVDNYFVNRTEATETSIPTLPINSSVISSGVYSGGLDKVLVSYEGIDSTNVKVDKQLFIRYKATNHGVAILGTNPAYNLFYAAPVVTQGGGFERQYADSVLDYGSGMEAKYTQSDVAFNTSVFAIDPVTEYQVKKDGLHYLWLVDLTRNIATDIGSSQFGGSTYQNVEIEGQQSTIRSLVATESALLSNSWVPCGKSVRLPKDNSQVILECTEGDTFIQRYDCLRIEPINKIDDEGTASSDSTNNYQSYTEVVSFPCETQINLDGRWDRNRYTEYVENMSSTNYGLLNMAYSQNNNFFKYKILDYKILNQDIFRTSFTWSAQKFSGESVDTWTALSMATVNDASGTYGPIRKLVTYNNELFGFQDRGIFNILFNNRVQVATSDNVPIEISNNYKVQGVRYLSNNRGTLGKLSVGISQRGIYFIDNYNKTITRFTLEGFNDISSSKGMRTWSYNNIVSKESTSYTDSDNFNIYIDSINNDIYFVSKTTCLCYNEVIDAFTGTYSYANTPFIVSIAGKVLSAPNGISPKLYEQFTGKYNEFFGNREDSYVTYKVNPEPLSNKIFNNAAFICDCYNIPESMNRITEEREQRIVEQNVPINNRIIESIPNINQYGGPELIYAPNRCFNKLSVWTEYQSGEAELKYMKTPSNLKKKFRLWRAFIPRHHNTIQRINNPWINMRFTLKQSEDENIKMLLHDMEVYYTI